MKNKSSAIKVLIINAVIMLILTKALNWQVVTSSSHFRYLIMTYVVMLVVIPVITYFVKPISNLVERVFQDFKHQFESIKTNYKKILIRVVMYLGLVFFGIVLEYAYSRVKGTNYNVLLANLVTCVSSVGLTLFLLRKEIGKKPEKLFLSLTIIMGSTIILSLPNNIGLSWDDGIHYSGVTSLANFYEDTGYYADDTLYPYEISVGHDHMLYSEAERAFFSDVLNESYANKELSEPKNLFGVSSVAYVPYAAGIIVGRALSLSYTQIFKLAKFFTLFAYGLIVYAAMKKLKFGKVLLATIALIPTVLYMTCNFSYDPWVIAWSLYGFAYFISFLQDRDKKVTRSDEMKMLGAFVIGLLPKATYFIMMLPLFLMPSTSFKNKKERQQYIVLVLISGLVLASSFALPFLIQGPGAGDTRGSTDVNSVEQVAFILSHPIQFLGIIGRFLAEYLSFSNIGCYTQDICYLNQGGLRVLTTVVIFVTAFLDRDGTKSKNKWLCIVSYVGVFFAIFLAAVALYISFTAVGSDTVAGCQPRYILPVVFLSLYTLGFDGVKNGANRNLFNALPMLFMTFTMVLNILLPLIRMY